MIASVLAFAAAATLAGAQSVPVPPNFDLGECVTGRLQFSPDRVFALPLGPTGDAARFGVDRSKYDFTLDYGNVDYVAGGGINLNFLPALPGVTPPVARGTRMSLTHYLKYGKITGRFTPLTEKGAISTLITWSDRYGMTPDGEIHDEIDWEIVGARPTKVRCVAVDVLKAAALNCCRFSGIALADSLPLFDYPAVQPEFDVFTYKTKFIENGVHGGDTPNSITPGQPHEFYIDWRSDRIEWGVDGVPFHTTFKNTSRALDPKSQMGPNDPWFPTSPSRVQFSVWDGAGDEWAGGSTDEQHDQHHALAARVNELEDQLAVIMADKVEVEDTLAIVKADWLAAIAQLDMMHDATAAQTQILAQSVVEHRAECKRLEDRLENQSAEIERLRSLLHKSTLRDSEVQVEHHSLVPITSLEDAESRSKALEQLLQTATLQSTELQQRVVTSEDLCLEKSKTVDECETLLRKQKLELEECKQKLSETEETVKQMQLDQAATQTQISKAISLGRARDAALEERDEIIRRLEARFRESYENSLQMMLKRTLFVGSDVHRLNCEHWVKDQDVTSCNHEGCTVQFGILVRRHHCRRCGNIFCHQHVSHRIRLSVATMLYDPNGAETKVCNECAVQAQTGAMLHMADFEALLSGHSPTAAQATR
eukprot:jgi/Hompol1/6827/HPOL_000295-RA